MRILHLIYDDVGNPWLGGGGAVRTREINSRLAGWGHEVTVGCGMYPGARRDELIDGVRYLRLPGPGWIAGRGGYAASRLGYVIGAVRLLKRHTCDIVIEDVSPYSPVFSSVWRRPASQAIASVQNLSGRHALGKFGWTPRGLLPLLVERPLLSAFDSAIAVSPGIASQMAPWWGRKRRGVRRRIAVIPNSAGSRHVEATCGCADAPARSAPAGRPYILFLGRLDLYQKGLDRLIAAYRLAADRLPGIGLVIAGGGAAADMARLTSWIEEAGLRLSRGAIEPAGGTVSLPGKLAPADAALALARSLFTALPSRYEAWPIVAVEAGACGKPVLGCDIVGVRDAAPATAHGLLVREGDTEELANGMVRLATDERLRHELGARGRAWAARFSWDALARRQELFYLETLATESRPRPGRDGRRQGR